MAAARAGSIRIASASLPRAVLEAVPTPIIAIDLEWRIVFANRAARRLSGVDPDTRTIRCFELAHHSAKPCDRCRDACPLRDVIATKEPVVVTHTHHDAEGREVYVAITAAPLFDDRGEVVGIVESWRDISERKTIRQLLEIANRHMDLRGLLEDAVSTVHVLTGCPAVAMAVLDEEGAVLRGAELGFDEPVGEFPGDHAEKLVWAEFFAHESAPDSAFCERTEGGGILVTSPEKCLDSLPCRTRRFLCARSRSRFGSLALIPIRNAGRTVAFIQLADPGEHAISRATVELTERVAMHLGAAILRIRAEESLRETLGSLEVLVRERTAELAAMNDALRSEITERNKLEKEILEISAAEQQRIGRELHDGLGQELTGLNCLAGALSRRLETRGLPEARVAAGLARGFPHLLAQVDRIVRGLMPLEIGAEDLGHAIEILLDKVEKASGVFCACSIPSPLEAVSADCAVQIYRIVQEAVNNALKHAKPREICVSLIREEGRTVLRVRDDGRGMPDGEEQTEGFGLRIMAYRARAVGGRLHIDRELGGGTVVTCIFPGEPSNER